VIISFGKDTKYGAKDGRGSGAENQRVSPLSLAFFSLSSTHFPRRVLPLFPWPYGFEHISLPLSPILCRGTLRLLPWFYFVSLSSKFIMKKNKRSGAKCFPGKGTKKRKIESGKIQPGFAYSKGRSDAYPGIRNQRPIILSEVPLFRSNHNSFRILPKPGTPPTE
jgi:hypothetical protein